MTARSIQDIADATSGSFPFINFVKTGGSVFSSPSNYPAFLDANGYPTAGFPGVALGSMKVPTEYSGDWIIDWGGQISTAGNAGIRLDFGGSSPRATLVSGGAFILGDLQFSLTLQGTNGSVRFRLNDPSANASIPITLLGTGSFSGFSRLRLYRADQANLVAAGEIFNPDFISQAEALNAYGWRFLDWFPVNGNADGGGITTNYSYLQATDALTYTGYNWRPELWAGDASGTDTYAVGNASGSNPLAYIDGESIHCRVLNANTATAPTLNRGSLGPKTIVTGLGGALSAGSISANQRATFTYNALMDKWIYSKEGLPAHVPLSVIFAFCNKLRRTINGVTSSGVDCWLPVPLLMNDAGWTSITQAARDTLIRGLWLELANEVWNFQNNQTSLSTIFGDLLGFASGSEEDLLSYYGLRMRQVMPLVTSTWTTSRSAADLHRICGVQSSAGLAGLHETFKFQGRALASVRTGTCTFNPSGAADTVIINLGTPIQCQNGNKLRFTSGSVPSGLSLNTDYFAVSASSFDGSCKLALTAGGAAISFTGGGTASTTYTNLPYQSKIGVDYNASPNWPIAFADVISYATYYQGAHIKAFQSQFDSTNIVPLMGWADDYATGTPALMASALNAVDADIRGAGSETLTDLNTNTYPIWNGLAVTYNKSVVPYEGSFQGGGPDAATCTSLGISTTYSTKIQTLMDAYKFDDRFKQLVYDQFTQFMTFSKSLYPCWYYFCFGALSQWSTHITTLYSQRYKSYDAIAQWNGDPAPPIPAGPGTAVPIPSLPGNKILTIGGITGG